MSLKYSVCITNYNTASTVRRSLDSILSQLTDDFEVIVVDQRSTDGSLEILEEFEAQKKITLVRQTRRNRGLGRQGAFERSSGQYILSNVDMDDIFAPGGFERALAYYHRVSEGKVLRLVGSFTIAPRTVVNELGGWHDLGYLEDVEFWGRAAMAGVYAWSRLGIKPEQNQHFERKTFTGKVRMIWTVQRAGAKFGYRKAEPSGLLKRSLIRLVRATVVFPPYRWPFFQTFNTRDPRYAVR